MSENAPTAVLVVEDELVIRLDLVDTLERAGFLTYEAGDASEAIAILEAHPEIRVIFTDIQMPGDMDGLKLSHYVRNRWPPTIIVVCSANVLASPALMPDRATFVGKPLMPETMTKLLADITKQLAL